MKTTRPVSALALAILAGSVSLQAQTATWTEITHPTSPAFAHHDMTYDSTRHRLIVAGRTAIMQNSFAAYAGAADGSWTQLPAPDPPLPGNHDVELAYDSHRDRVILYTTATNLVWEFDGTAWTVIAAATTPIQCFDGALMQYDPLRRKTVLVGANEWPDEGAASETWFWDGADWSLATSTDASPVGAAGGGMAFDAARGEMVLLTMKSMQTWTFDGTTWTRRQPATVPSPALWVFDLAYDPVKQVSVFFGGEATEPELLYPRDAWAWNGTDWKKLEAGTVPPPDIDYALTYFPERGGLVLHGGWGPGGEWGFRTNVWLLTLQSLPAPQLDIRRIDNGVVVSWPTWAQDWNLESVTPLPTTGASSWTVFPAPYQVEGSTFQLVEPAPVGDRFYRLRKP